MRLCPFSLAASLDLAIPPNLANPSGNHSLLQKLREGPGHLTLAGHKGTVITPSSQVQFYLRNLCTHHLHRPLSLIRRLPHPFKTARNVNLALDSAEHLVAKLVILRLCCL